VYDMLIQIFGWMAEEESENKSKRIKQAIRQKDDGAYSYTGKKWGRWKLPKQTITRIKEKRARGMSMREIAKDTRYWQNGKERHVSLGKVCEVLKNEKKKNKQSNGNIFKFRYW